MKTYPRICEATKISKTLIKTCAVCSERATRNLWIQRTPLREDDEFHFTCEHHYQIAKAHLPALFEIATSKQLREARP
jgi:hypothetical protein